MTASRKGFFNAFKDVWMLDGVRTPMVDYCGSLGHISPTDLGIKAARAVLARAGVPGEHVGTVITGNMAPGDYEQFMLPRHISLYAGVPQAVPALMTQRICGTGFELFRQAGEQIESGCADVALLTGAESMTRNPIAAFTHRTGFKLGAPVEFKDFLWEALNDSAAGITMIQTAGLILLAAAPCTAMVFVWSRLTNGHPLFTLSQVALNDTIMVFAFAPLVAFLLGISAITVPWDTLLTSVVLYIVIPVVIAQLWRKALLAKGQGAFDAAMEKIGPWSITALLATLVLLFAFQGEAILRQPLIIGLLAVPILIQVFFNSALAYWLNRKVGEKHNVACPSALIGASNFFELAVAAAISLFGFESGAALATVVGVLIEVPVMLLVVRVVNASKGWYERA